MVDALDLLDLLNAPRSPCQTVGWRDGRAMSFAEFLARVRAWRALLRRSNGRTFALYLEDSIEFAGAFDRAEQHAATAADFTWVQDLGIAGFPTLLAERNGQLALLTNGYQPLSELSPLLGRWLERATCA